MTDIPALGQCIIDWAYSNDDYTYPRSIDHIFDDSFPLAILDVLNEIVLDDEACAAFPAEIAQEENEQQTMTLDGIYDEADTAEPVGGEPSNQEILEQEVFFLCATTLVRASIPENLGMESPPSQLLATREMPRA